MSNSAIGLIIFIIGWIGGRLISEKGIKELSDEERGRLLGGFSRYRIFSLVGVIAVVAAHFIAKSAYPNSFYSSYRFFLVFLVFYLLLNSFLTFRKLRQLDMPDVYITKFLLSTLVQFIAMLSFFGLMLKG